MTKYPDKKVQMEMIFLPFWAEKKSYSEKLVDYSGNLFDYSGKLVDYSMESVGNSMKVVDYSALSADCNKRNQLTAMKKSADSSARVGRGALSPAEKIIKIILSYFIFAGVGEKKRGFNTLLIFIFKLYIIYIINRADTAVWGNMKYDNMIFMMIVRKE